MIASPTIFALSSGQPPSGIAVVRTSGPQSGEALRSLAGKLPHPRRATRAMLRATDGTQLDDALVLWFPAPNSATGEDVAEFHCHGGRAVVASVIAALSKIDGLRAAEPGEFSRRAFEHGKLDLIAAEALDDLIHADTEAQRRQAFRQLNGLLGDRARDWRQRIIAASALIEAGIDFSDEGDVADDLTAPALAQIAALRAEMADVLDAGGKGERLREGLVVAIMGFPNVGKSALLNKFARREVAIVTPHAGTTRDPLEVRLDLEGFPITLVDTAGLRETSDPVEQEGIRRARERAADADLILWLSDSRVADHSSVSGRTPVWKVRTKIDLGGHQADADADHRISTVTGAGLNRLIAALAEFAAVQFPTEQGLMTRERHRALLVTAADALTKAGHETEPELVAEGLRQATATMGRLLGRVDVEDVLGEIFARFCIGK